MSYIRIHEFIEKHFFIIAFFFFLALELFCFWNSIRGDGFYPDDWIIFDRIHFIDPSFQSIIKAFVFDDRLVIRPIMPMILATLYFFFRENPFPYHLMNSVFELMSAWCIFRLVLATSSEKTIAFIAASIFILYPTHDFTHHSMVLNIVSLGITLFVFSLWQFVEAIQTKNNKQLYFSALVYFLGVFVYEGSLPLVIIYPLIHFMFSKKQNNWKNTLLTTLQQSILFFLPVLALLVYRKYLLPAFHIGWNYAMVFNPMHFFNVILQGLKVSISPYAFAVFISLAYDCLRHGLSIGQWIMLFSTFILSAAIIYCSYKSEKIVLKVIIVTSIIGLIFSYTIFGLSPEHMPDIINSINRVNAFGSIFSSLLLAVAIVWLSSKLRQARIVMALATAALLSLFLLANWEFSKPWNVSWSAQKLVRRFIKSKANEIRSGDSIVLANWPRFVRWCPALDGVWDFQALLHVTLDDPSIRGTTISERVVITNDALIEKVGSKTVGRLPFKRMFILIPAQGVWVFVDSKEKFIAAARQLNVDLTMCRLN
jgi:hypothetical protein